MTIVTFDDCFPFGVVIRSDVMLTLKLSDEALVGGMNSIPPDVLQAVHTLESSSLVFAIKWGDVWIRSHPQEHGEQQAGLLQAGLLLKQNPTAPTKETVSGDLSPKSIENSRPARDKIPRGYVWNYVKKYLKKVRVGERMTLLAPEGVPLTLLQNKMAAWCGQEWGAGCYVTQQHKEIGVVEVWRLKPPIGEVTSA